MSYILDALKKSERERTLVRGVRFVDAGLRLPRSADGVWWLIGVGSVIVAAVVAGSVYWARAGAGSGSAVGSPIADTAERAGLKAADQSSPSPALLITPDRELSWASTLAPEFQSSLPPMAVNIHVYTPDESQRILYINNRQYRRGGEIPGGVVVEEIVPDGVVLRFRGQRFKLPRPS
jgi:hypothetical protein